MNPTVAEASFIQRPAVRIALLTMALLLELIPVIALALTIAAMAS